MSKKRGAAPGSNNGGGRKKSERKLKGFYRILFEDQFDVESKDIRQAIVEFKEKQSFFNEKEFPE